MSGFSNEVTFRGPCAEYAVRALTIADGVADITPVIFGDAGRPAVVGSTTVAILTPEAGVQASTLRPFHVGAPTLLYQVTSTSHCKIETWSDGMSWEERISIDPKVQGGKPVIKGTRVPLEVIVGALAGGDSIESVCDDYRLAEDDVRAALAYAAEMLRLERVYALPRR